MKNKIKLYHYSNKDIDKIKPAFFGDNHYTLNDRQVSEVKRIFFYTDVKNIEYRFKGAIYLYIAEISEGKIYDLRQDKRGLISKYHNNINGLLLYIKSQYQGAIYNIGNLNIAILFKDIKPIEKIKIQKGVDKMEVYIVNLQGKCISKIISDNRGIKILRKKIRLSGQQKNSDILVIKN